MGFYEIAQMRIANEVNEQRKKRLKCLLSLVFGPTTGSHLTWVNELEQEFRRQGFNVSHEDTSTGPGRTTITDGEVTIQANNVGRCSIHVVGDPEGQFVSVDYYWQIKDRIERRRAEKEAADCVSTSGS